MPRTTVAVLGTGTSAQRSWRLWTAELAGRAAARARHRLCRGIAIGGDQAARAGRLLVLAVGAEHAREWVQPIFDTIGRRTVCAIRPTSASSPVACKRGCGD
jgi:3-hydroxyisobutyrate dehydrogenase-like beta-hydroxyacid dehydrogenase